MEGLVLDRRAAESGILHFVTVVLGRALVPFWLQRCFIERLVEHQALEWGAVGGRLVCGSRRQFCYLPWVDCLGILQVQVGERAWGTLQRWQNTIRPAWPHWRRQVATDGWQGVRQPRRVQVPLVCVIVRWLSLHSWRSGPFERWHVARQRLSI